MSRAAGSRDDGGPHGSWFFHSSTGGALALEIDGRAFGTVVEGGCFLVPPGCRFRFHGPATGGVWCHFVVWPVQAMPAPGAWHGSGAVRALAQPTATALWGVELPPLLAPLGQRRCAAWLHELHHHWRAGRPGRVLRAHALLDRMLTAWAEGSWSGRPADPSGEARIAVAEDLARRRLADPGFGVAEMAAAIGWGRQHFAREYRRLRGEAPSAFLRRARIDEACERLEHWSRSAAAIGASVGYPHRAAFLRAFRAATGTTPAGWRAGLRRGPIAKA